MYCALDDLKAAITERVLLQLTDDEKSGQFIDSPPNKAYARAVEAITRVDALIDGYISGRYVLPLSPVPAIIKNISINLTICELYGRKHEAVTPEGVIERYKNNIKILEKIQEGKVILPGHKKDEPGPGYSICNKTDDDRIFSDSLLRKF